VRAARAWRGGGADGGTAERRAGRRLLATHEEELQRISDLLAADGAVGAQLAAKRAAVRAREQELRALEGSRAELEQRMRAFSGESRRARPRLRPCRALAVRRAPPRPSP